MLVILVASIVVGIVASPAVLKIVTIVGDDFHDRFGENYEYLGYFLGLFPAAAFVYLLLFFFLNLLLKILRV